MDNDRSKMGLHIYASKTYLMAVVLPSDDLLPPGVQLSGGLQTMLLLQVPGWHQTPHAFVKLKYVPA